MYGDWQFEIDDKNPDFSMRGTISACKPTEDNTFTPAEDQRSLTPDDWEELIYLTHFDKKKAWDKTLLLFYLQMVKNIGPTRRN